MGDLPKMAIFEVPPWVPQKIFEIFSALNPRSKGPLISPGPPTLNIRPFWAQKVSKLSFLVRLPGKNRQNFIFF